MAPPLQLGIHRSSLERESWDVEECLAWARDREIGFFEAGAEFPAECGRECGSGARLRTLLDSHGIVFTALEVTTEAWGREGNSAGFALDAHIQWARAAGCRQLVLTGLETEDADGTYARIAATAERCGISIGVELSGAVLDRAGELHKILERIDSPLFRAVIDTGHVLSAGKDPLEVAEAFEGRIGHFRMRIGSGEYAQPPLRSMIELLLDGGYRGGFGILDESGGAPALAGSVEDVRRMLESANFKFEVKD